jgi:hypothetical protein
MIEKTKVKKMLNDYVKILKGRKETTMELANKMLRNCPTQSLQQIVKNDQGYKRLITKSQFYSEIIEDVCDLLDAFEEEN